MRSYVRKIVMSGLVATAALLGCAGPAFAETGTTGTAGVVTVTAGGKSADAAFLQAIAARYPAKSAAGLFVASLERLSAARPQASASTTDVTAGNGMPSRGLRVAGRHLKGKRSAGWTSKSYAAGTAPPGS
jgi:hypothetical protein